MLAVAGVHHLVRSPTGRAKEDTRHAGCQSPGTKIASNSEDSRPFAGSDQEFHQPNTRRRNFLAGRRVETARMSESMAPRYPDIHVRLNSRNPYALISAVRLALRQAQVDESEVYRFTEEALEVEEPRRMRAVCNSWADISVNP